MLGGAYSSQFKVMERHHVDTIKTIAENEKTDSIARAKKLSIETNRRRRALAIKRKTEAEREEKRRQQILAKRREKQKEATEKFQRAHISSRPNSGTSNASSRWSPRRNNSQLEDALRLVRGSPTGPRINSARGPTSPTQSYRSNTDPLSKPYFNKYAHPSINNGHTPTHKREDLHNKSQRNLANSRNLFEQQLESYQQNLLEQQQKSLRDFNNQIMKEIEVERYEYQNQDPDQDSRGSVTPVDSLDGDSGSTDTLRESCDIDAFMQQKQQSIHNGTIPETPVHSGTTPASVVHNGMTPSATRTVSFAQDDDRNTIRQASQTHTPAHVQPYIAPVSANSMLSQNIDSSNSQLPVTSTTLANDLAEEQRQQHYRQRQAEIQQQILEQRLQKERQEEDLKARVLEQQRKQQLMLQKEYEKRQQEQLDKVRQQQQQLAFAVGQSVAPAPAPYDTIDSYQDNTPENQRPKVQSKAWATPSPQPYMPTNVLVSTPVTAPSLVTRASPYTGKNTQTNTTVTTYDKTPLSANGQMSSNMNSVSSKSSSTVTANGSSVNGVNSNNKNTSSVINTNNQTSVVYNNANVNVAANRIVENTQPLVHQSEYTGKVANDSEKSMSFLASVTERLEKRQEALSNNTQCTMSSSATPVKATPPSPSSVTQNTSVNQTSKASTTNTTMPVKVATVTSSTVLSKPPTAPHYFVTSYGAAYAAKQQQNASNTSNQVKQQAQDASAVSNNTTRHGNNNHRGATIQWASGTGNGEMFTADGVVMNGEDATDTDSVSTIYEEKDAEPKEVKSILKRPPSGKKGGILKKSDSTGNMKDIRDSLEITRVNLQTSADDKEQRIKAAEQRKKSTVTKKNVRFDEQCYYDDDVPPSNPDQLFVRRNDSSDTTPQRLQRPQSAVTAKQFQPKLDTKPPRATSATNTRSSSISRAKTQIVRPQAAAHIITQASTQNIDATSVNELDKKVTIVNSNFMEKVPSVAQTKHTSFSVTPSSVYAITSASYVRPEQQKGNYAVSSIIMPKNESAPFLYPGGYTKQGPVPAGSANGPVQSGGNVKYDGAVYDENGVRVDRTPTDDEINFLWDKLRNCLSRNNNGTADTQTVTGSRQAAPVSHTYIDGNALGQINSLNRVASAQNNNNNNSAMRRQNSLDGANGSYTRRYGLLQQRKQQPNPNSLKAHGAQQQQQGYAVYQAPVPSHTEPLTTATLQNGVQDVTESMAGFLAAEQLAEQSVSESHIHQAMEEAQARQMAYNAARPQPKVKSALSIEEQRLMESLDRLNDKLKVTTDGTNIPVAPLNSPVSQQPIPQAPAQQQQPIAPTPPLSPRSQQQQQRQKHVIHRSSFLNADGKVGGFKGHAPLTAQRRIIETGNQKARLRITSAVLKRNIHRQQ